MASSEIAKPFTVRFRGRSGAVVHLAAPLPADTMDPRWAACTDHRVACDCREAETAENLHEYRAEREAAVKAFNEVLASHQTFAWTPQGDRDAVAECKCTGCVIARRLHYRRDWDVSRDREAAGLTP